jgi:L,D-transpeptidase ErfK/SrfK
MKKTQHTVIRAFFLILFTCQLSYASIIAGDQTVYSIEENDSLLLISAKLGVDVDVIIRDNNLKDVEPIAHGERLKLNTRKIAPKTVDNGIIIDIAGRMLFYFKAGKLEQSFPVGLGMAKWLGSTHWRTPSGSFAITGKERNPVWYVPDSIQHEMQTRNKPVLTRVQPGSDNPLGSYVLYTSIKGICIHETIWPTTVYRYRSHGCIRVLKQHIAQLYDAIDVGTIGELVYEPIKIAVTHEGEIYLEADPDVYGKAGDYMDKINQLCNSLSIAEKVDWEKVKKVIIARTGNAENITRYPESPKR